MIVHIFQLILATMPDIKGGKSSSIVSDDNIQLLFEIQKKVFQVLDEGFLNTKMSYDIPFLFLASQSLYLYAE